MENEWIGVLDGSPGVRSIRDQQMQDMYGTGTKELYQAPNMVCVLRPYDPEKDGPISEAYTTPQSRVPFSRYRPPSAVGRTPPNMS
jgi:hypothetical protein